MPTSLRAGCGHAEGRPRKCQPLSMVTLIMSKFFRWLTQAYLCSIEPPRNSVSVTPSVTPQAFGPMWSRPKLGFKYLILKVERVKGIEPSSSAWKDFALSVYVRRLPLVDHWLAGGQPTRNARLVPRF